MAKKYIHNIIVVFVSTSFLFSAFNSLDDLKEYIEPLKKYFKSTDKSDDLSKQYENLPIELKLNVHPNRIDSREWIPYINNHEISQEQFWKLMGDSYLEIYWHKKEKIKKSALKDRFHFNRVMLALSVSYIGYSWHKKSEYDNDEANIGAGGVIRIRNGSEYVDSPKSLLYIPANLLVIYEFGNGAYGLLKRIFGKSFPLKNQVSYYDILDRVTKYNQGLKMKRLIGE